MLESDSIDDGSRRPPEAETFDIKDMILHHMVDSEKWEFMFWTIYLPQFEPVQVGPLSIDFSITKHVLFMFFAAVLVALTLIPAARRAKRAREAGAAQGPRGGGNVVEAFVLYLRDEVAKPNVGHHGERFYPYIISVFFFILFCNLLGLVPWGTSPTANISVTAALAASRSSVVETAGVRELGWPQYSKTIFYAPPGTHGVHQVPDAADHDAGGVPGEADQAVRAGDPALREHDGREGRDAGADGTADGRGAWPTCSGWRRPRSSWPWASACSRSSSRSCRRTSSPC
jgi:F0F1-type ATP synthase membrane subunit a